MAETKFHIREICHSPTDGDFILSAFDSALPHLASVGSGGQWGTTPFSEIPERRQRAYDSIVLSEASRLNEEGRAGDGRLFIAEVEMDHGSNLQGLSVRNDDRGKRFLSVAACGVRDKYWPEHLKAHENTKAIFEKANAQGACYLDILISDFRTGTARKGAGAALIHRAKDYSVSRGLKVLYLDCWSGNGGNLVKFYTGQGFVKVADFLIERPGADGWPGCVLKLELET